MSDRAQLNAELDELNPQLLAACERYVRERSEESFRAWLVLNQKYVELHRKWWQLVNPEVDYESVFGKGVEGVS